jgi:hypothetical protein
MEDSFDISVQPRLSLLIKERFGPDSEFFTDDILVGLLLRHDMSHLLEQPDIAVQLRTASNTSPGAQRVSDKLSRLHREYGCLWILHEIALSGEPIQVASRFAAIASLDVSDAARLSDLVQLYDQVCQHLAAEEKIEVSDWKSRLAAVPEPFLESYLNATFSEHFSSEDSFFPPALSRATGTEDGSAFLPQAVLKALFNRERCVFLIHTYEKLGKAYFADAARFVLSYALFLAHSFRAEEYLRSNGAEMGQMLDRLDSYDGHEAATAGKLDQFLLGLRGSMRVVLGMSSSVSPGDRIKNLERGVQLFSASADINTRQQGLNCLRILALLSPESERPNLQALLLERATDLLAEIASEENKLTRLIQMAGWNLLLANVKLDKGDFQESIEYATAVKSLGLASLAFLRQAAEQALDDFRNSASASSSSPAQSFQNSPAGNFLSFLGANVNVIIRSSEALILVGRLKQAETRCDFDGAYAICQQAAEIEKQIQSQYRDVLGAFRDVLAPQGDLPLAESQYEARSAHWKGMGLLNRGDGALMRGQHSEALQAYGDAQETFRTAIDRWSLLASSAIPIKLEDPTYAVREYNVDRAWLRYVDAKLQVAQGEFRSSLAQPKLAADHFEKAATIFGELLANVQIAESNRDVQIYCGSEEYCSARYQLECCLENLDTPAPGMGFNAQTLERGRNLLESAARRFQAQGETRWAAYIKALRHEYDAMIAVKVAAASAEPDQSEHLGAAQQSAYQGAQILRDLGLAERATVLEVFAKDTAQRPSYATTLVPLPKPALGAGGLESALDQRLSDAHLDDHAQGKVSAAADSKPLNGAPAATIFVSYARIDNEGPDLNKRWLDRLVVFLKPIGIQEDLIIWNDKQLKTGEAWHETIPSKLKSAKAVILLISPEFLGSDFIRETELPIILQRHADEQLKIFPLILRPSVFQRAKYKYPHPKDGPNEILLSSIMTVNPPSQALNEIDEGKQDRFFVKLADDLLEQLGKHP